MITISFNGHRWEADIIKSASLSSGYRVYLFRRYIKGLKPSITGEFFVAAKDSHNSIVNWVETYSLKTAIECYTGLLCCYA